MRPDPEAARARRYLLGQSTEDERSAIEQEYVRDDGALDRMSAVEDDLIEEYVAGHLQPAERREFERQYLTSPGHRRRVEVVRHLTASAQRRAPGRKPIAVSAAVVERNRRIGWLAAAAAVILVAAGSLWLIDATRENMATTVENSAPPSSTGSPAATPDAAVEPPRPAPPAARVLAVAISPVTVRGGNDNPSVILPKNIDTLVLHLQGGPDDRNRTGGHASIRTVDGDEVWQGPVTVDSSLPAGVIARLEVPAGSLTTDDYIVAVFAKDAAGVEQERARYYVRVRAQED